jgi:ribosomal protein S18 acetylase RimI-like enzyme
MSDGASGSAPRRPDTARPRSDVRHDAAAAPNRDELERIERQQVDWPALLGAELVDEPYLGAVLMRHRDPGPGFNVATRIRWPQAEVDDRLDELEARMREADRWPSLIVSDGLTEPADLEQHLHARGWSRLSGEQTMFTRHAPVVPHLDPGLRVEAVTPASALESAALENVVFGLPPVALGEQAELLAGAVETGAVRAFLLRLLGEPVATARLAPGHGVAGLHGIAVAEHHRRRGYGRMITAVATRAGLVIGRGLVWLSVDESNSAAIDLYRGLGYEASFTRTRWAAPTS